MPHSPKILVLPLMAIMMSGCSSMSFFDQDSSTSRLCANDDGEFHTCRNMSIQEQQKISKETSLFSTDLHFQVLGDYTEQMATALQQDIRGRMIDGSIVVASFVYLDESLQTTDQLGVQLAEFFINDLQQVGLQVSDHKLTGALKVNTQGDFVFSRNQNELRNVLDIAYVVSGTMLKNQSGIMVNARLINFKTNEIVATSSKLLPNLIVNQLL